MNDGFLIQAEAPLKTIPTPIPALTHLLDTDKN